MHGSDPRGGNVNAPNRVREKASHSPLCRGRTVGSDRPHLITSSSSICHVLAVRNPGWGDLMMGLMPPLSTMCPAVALSGAPYETHHNFQIKTYD